MARPSSSRRARGRAPRGRPPRRRESKDDDDIPEVYREMLAEADARASNQPDIGNRPLKRRKVGEQPAASPEAKPAKQASPLEDPNEGVAKPLQMAYESAASDDSDMEWEEVDIQQPSSDVLEPSTTAEASDEPLQITLNKHTDTPSKAIVARRKPITAAERKLRLDIHKVHLLCLLSHVQLRNLWCNDDEVQDFLKKILPRQTINFLNPKEGMPQFTRSTTFVDGLRQASEAFSRRFRVTGTGLKRPHWAENPKSLDNRAEAIVQSAEAILSKEDFRKQVKTMRGSRDFGAQLFCALLRSAAVETRLVCSLQPLPFTGTVKGLTPVKPGPRYIVISSDDRDSSTDDKSRSQTPAATTPPTKVRRIGQPQFTPSVQRGPPQTPPRTGTLRPSQESPFPVFWVEAFNDAVQKWIPVDPLVTKTVAKASKFEPPASDRYNTMTYVVAFEDDASARDVTRRYARSYNAKTLRNRVESTKGGNNWWQKTISFFEKPFMEDRDQVEIGELTAKTGAEPMPRNVQDFKDHPVYALERHLRRNEAIFPKRVIGQVALGKSGSKNQVLEPVYRRADVHTVRSADGWYRLGRDIKVGEQPLKRVSANRIKATDINEDEEGVEETAETPLYAGFQTELYNPPPVIKGKVPKNAYGNIDIYVPSMVPPGAFHLKHPESARAARILGIDYADAVTGFEFKGRHGTAVLQGIVAASQYREALEEVLRCLEDERTQAELDRKTAEALRLWKHFLVKLRIVERVKNYAVEGEEADDEVSASVDGDEEKDYEGLGGGFFPEPDQETARPTAVGDSNAFSEISAGVYNQEDPTHFVKDEDDSFGGGFVPEESMETTEPEPSTYVPTRSLGQNDKKLDLPEKTRSRYSLVVVPSDKAKEERAPDIDLTAGTPSDMTYGSELGGSGGKELEFEAKALETMTSKDLRGSSEAPITLDSSSDANSRPASVQIISRPVSQTQSRAQSTEAMQEASDNVSEVSLLSHDPEDDDAEPEWLLSD